MKHDRYGDDYDKKAIRTAIETLQEIERTQKALRAFVACRQRVEKDSSNSQQHGYSDPHRSAAVRASMDLTRKLAEFRATGVTDKT